MRVIDGIPVWGDPDAPTLEQIRRCAAADQAAGAALMGDAHKGYSQPIGGVVAFRDAVSPSGVGYDIACVDRETECLTPSGWVRMCEYAGGPVMQYDPITGSGEFVEPTAYITRPCERFLHFRTKFGVDQMVDATHRMLVWRMRGGRRIEAMPSVLRGADLADEHNRLKLGARVYFETAVSPVLSTALDLTDAEVRVQVMFLADGCLETRRTGVVQVKKQRKAERALALLKNAGINYSCGQSGECRWFRFAPPLPTKGYSDMWRASADQLRVISEECIHWDGNAEQQCFYTRNRDAADFIQYAFMCSGLRAVLLQDRRSDGTIDYRVFRHARTRAGLAGTPKTPVDTVASADGFAYCFTVPSGFWVSRRNGKTAMTGNCGIYAVETDADETTVCAPLSIILDDIRRAVSFGVGRTNPTPVDHPLFDDPLWLDDKNVASLRDRAAAQLGTVGSGNHFVDLLLDEFGHVWIAAHFGSRGFGHGVASGFLNLAAGRAFHDRAPGENIDADPTLIPAASDLGQSYIRAMELAGEYAYAGREYVVRQVCRILGAHVGEQVHNHHNFAWLEEHGGEKVWVVRKGATPAWPGQVGFVGGSMADISAVVEGVDTPESSMAMHSTIHGAGRIMSRTAAKGKFRRGVEKQKGAVTRQMMAERCHSFGVTVRGGDVDESPHVYRPLAGVLAEHADSLKVRHILRPIGVVMAGADVADPYKD